MNHFHLRVNQVDKLEIIISVSKKISKKAVVRNKIKRRVRAVMQSIIPKLKPAQYLIIAKIGAEKIKGKELHNELFSLIR